MRESFGILTPLRFGFIVDEQSAEWLAGLTKYDRLTRLMRAAVAGITADQIQTFLTVMIKHRCSQTDIGRSTGFSRQATSRHAAKLVASGLLLQQRDPENGRRRLLYLGPLGRLIAASVRTTFVVKTSSGQAAEHAK